MEKKIEQLIARKKQRQKQQGLGRRIISTFSDGYRIVKAGDVVYKSKDWKTFHDFLLYYIAKTLGLDWGKVELKKDLLDRHPIIQWYDLGCKHLKKKNLVGDKVQRIPMTGAVAAYLGLAYNLYLIAHNAEIKESLIKRLKNKDQFLGTYYETYVAATFIKAGFDLEFENEADGSMSHCEFTATYLKTGAKFSIEAKARVAGKPHADVGNQLYDALTKEANHTRVIFIDVNMPDDASHQDSMVYLKEALDSIRGREQSLKIHDEPAPPAYVIVTNHSYQYNLETSNFRCSALAEGFKIHGFKMDAEFPNIRAALRAQEKHYEMFMLMDSVWDHYEIPST